MCMARIRTSFARVAVAAALLALGAAVAAPQKDRGGALPPDGAITAKTRAVLTADDAYLFGRPELVAESDALPLGLSPDGRALLIARIRRHLPRGPALPSTAPPSPGGELDLIFWDSRIRQPVIVYREAFPDGAPDPVAACDWLPGSRVALIELLRPDSSTRTLLRLDAAAPAPQAHRVTELEAWDHIEVSPTGALAYLESLRPAPSQQPRSGMGTTLRVLRADSPRMTDVTLPGGVHFYQWAADGMRLVSARTVGQTPEGKKRSVPEHLVVDLTTGQAAHPDQLPPVAANDAGDAPQKAVAALPIRLETAPATVTTTDPKRADRSVDTVWLESAQEPPAKKRMRDREGGPALLATDAEAVTLLGDGSAALIQRDGALYAVPLYRMNRRDFAESLRLAQRLAAISNAKQIGLATLMYVQDYDETLPRADGDLRDLIGPYLKDTDAFNNPATGKNGFTQTYQGTASLGQIASPASTEFGSVQGPGGRAILYLDGHVTWIDDLAP